MDANYVMDETLGNASYDIAKLSIGQKKLESFLIGKVSYRGKKKLNYKFKNTRVRFPDCICTLPKLSGILSACGQ